MINVALTHNILYMEVFLNLAAHTFFFKFTLTLNNEIKRKTKIKLKSLTATFAYFSENASF